jgi:hypothetical protein
MTFYYEKTITEEMISLRTWAKFVFGDNLQRVGRGGLAKVCRGKWNTIGVATKSAPSMEPGSFFSDKNDIHWTAMCRDLAEVSAAHLNYDIILPRKPIGTGTSELNLRAPRIYDFMLSFFHGIDPNCPWPKPGQHQLKLNL